MNGSMKHILIVARDPVNRISIQQLLTGDSEQHYVFIEAELGVVALSMIERNDSFPFDCVLFEEPLKDITAREFLTALCKNTRLPSCPVVVLSDDFDVILPTMGNRGSERIPSGCPPLFCVDPSREQLVSSRLIMFRNCSSGIMTFPVVGSRSASPNSMRSFSQFSNHWAILQ